MRVTNAQLGQQIALVAAQQSSMLIRDIAVANFALALRTQESGISQDRPTDELAVTTGRHGRGHASHRMPEKNGSAQLEAADETHEIACMIVVPISVERRTRFA